MGPVRADRLGWRRDRGAGRPPCAAPAGELGICPPTRGVEDLERGERNCPGPRITDKRVGDTIALRFTFAIAGGSDHKQTQGPVLGAALPKNPGHISITDLAALAAVLVVFQGIWSFIAPDPPGFLFVRSVRSKRPAFFSTEIRFAPERHNPVRELRCCPPPGFQPAPFSALLMEL